MADKEARVRLTLNNAGFLGGLRQTTDEVKRQGAAMAHAFHKPLLGGLDSAKKSLVNLGSEAKTAAKFGLALGGSFSLGAAAKGAFDLRHEISNLAFAIRAGTGDAVSLDALGVKLETTANNWSQANRQVVASYRSIYEQIGDAQFASGVIDAVGEAATASGKSMDVFANIASDTFKFFGVGAQDMRQALAAVISFGEQGGLTIEEIADRIGQMGASAKLAGASGMEGLSRVLGMANMADGSLGKLKEKIGAVKGLFDRLNNPEEAKRIGKEIHAQLTDKSGNVKSDALNTIIAKTGGDAQKINALFGTGSKEAKLIAQFGDIFKRGGDDSGLKGSKRVEAGLAALDAAFAKAAESNLTAEAMREEATRKARSSETAIQRSMNALEQAFAKPEMIAAIDSLANSAPKLASGIATLLETVVNHPVMAALGFAGGRAALAGVGSLASSAASGVGGLSKDLLMARLNRGGSRTEAIFDSMGMQTGTRTIDVPASKLKNAAVVAGQALAIAAAAAMVYELGKAGIDKFLGDSLRGRNDVENAAAVADANIGSGDKASQRAALKAVREQIDKLKREGPGILESIMGGIATVATGGDTKSAGEMHANALARAERTASDLEKSLADTSKGGDRVTKSLGTLGSAIDSAAQKLNKLGSGSGGDGSNGPPPSPGNAPGYG